MSGVSAFRPFAVALAALSLSVLGVCPPAGAACAGASASVAAGRSVYLEDLTWMELRDAVRAGKTTAIIPIGGTEQSGPAIVLGKHNARVRWLSGRIAQELGNALVAPVVAYVPEGSTEPPSSHMRFPGTITVPPAVFDATLASIADSLRIHGFRTIVFLGDHGGYQKVVARLAHRLNRKWAPGTRVLAPPEYFRASFEGFAQILRERGYRADELGTHAGLLDTSLSLAVDPALVRTDLLHAKGVPFDTAHGVYHGDPRRATAALGRLGLDEIVRKTVAAIRAQERR